MRILMVCLGNICRSPLAQGILEHQLSKNNIPAEVDSAGTAAYHAGESPDVRSQDIAAKYGIDISGQRARKFLPEDFDRFDLIYVMDRENYSNVAARARNEQDLGKIILIMNEVYPGQSREVPDPYYGGNDGFEKVYRMLEKASEKIIEKLNHSSK
jgi:protein-tyrosine phosphatase